MDMKTEIARRDINQHNAFLFAVFAGMVDLGLVNQGVVNELGKKTAAYMINYYSARDFEFTLGNNSLKEDVSYLFDYFNGDLNFVKEYTVERSGEGVQLSISSQLCRICPKGLGGAEIKGTLCIIPYFFMHLMNYYLARNNQLTLQKDRPPVTKESGNCVISYDLAT
jgi:hypothetical protein